MLRPKKKISKRELKEDALITSYVRATTFYETHKKNVSIAITVIVVILLAAVVYFKNRAENNEKAITQLAGIFQSYDAGEYHIAIDGIPERNVPGLKSIVENFGNSPTGDLARFYLANALFNTGNFDEALKDYQDFSSGNELLAISRLHGIAGCYEAKGNYKEAAEYFEKAATKYDKDLSAAENLNNAARNYGQAGEKGKAIELYRKIKKNHPTSVFAREADRFIAQLSV